jgi:hypothetical protein
MTIKITLKVTAVIAVLTFATFFITTSGFSSLLHLPKHNPNILMPNLQVKMKFHLKILKQQVWQALMLLGLVV